MSPFGPSEPTLSRDGRPADHHTTVPISRFPRGSGQEGNLLQSSDYGTGFRLARRSDRPAPRRAAGPLAADGDRSPAWSLGASGLRRLARVARPARRPGAERYAGRAGATRGPSRVHWRPLGGPLPAGADGRGVGGDGPDPGPPDDRRGRGCGAGIAPVAGGSRRVGLLDRTAGRFQERSPKDEE